MERPDYIPADYKRIKVVSSLSELFNTSFGGRDEVNAALLPRQITGDFNALAQRLGKKYSAYSLEDLEKMKNLPDAENQAVQAICNDMRELQSQGMMTILNVVNREGYRMKEIHDFHADREARREFGRICCGYNDPVTEAVRNEDAILVDDIFYQMSERAEILQFRSGDIWKHCTANDCGIPPYIHRAPASDRTRLFLVADFRS